MDFMSTEHPLYVIPGNSKRILCIGRQSKQRKKRLIATLALSLLLSDLRKVI